MSMHIWYVKIAAAARRDEAGVELTICLFLNRRRAEEKGSED